MQEHEKTLYTLLVIGFLAALGKMLDGNDPITPRLFSRVIIGSLTSTTAGAVLLQVPGASPLLIIGLGLRWVLVAIRLWKSGYDVKKEG